MVTEPPEGDGGAEVVPAWRAIQSGGRPLRRKGEDSALDLPAAPRFFLDSERPVTRAGRTVLYRSAVRVWLPLAQEAGA
jgi:hypothetical protein